MRTAEDIIRQKGGEIHAVPVDATLYEAVAVMVEKKIGAVLVREGDKMVGIWTERDLLRGSLQEGFDLRRELISRHMSKPLITVPHTDTIYRLMDKILGLRLRHLPVEKEGKIIGVLSSGDVIRAALLEKTREYEELNKMLGWEYYENWRWKK
ncbi:MAG: CBS domain-containing protein [candidate division KSB1 bacterium]|nr:CBS domain-containing protein [candidate division KSB1 bacterium]